MKLTNEEAIRALKKKHSGPCAILANGRSLLKHDLSRLTCPTIGVNRAWRYNPTYHVCSDDIHGRKEPEVYARLDREGRLFVVDSPNWKVGMRLPLIWRRRRPRPTPPPFSFDLLAGVQVAIESNAAHGSVVYVALQVACWLGFDTIYILGLDLKGPRFVDDGWSQAPSDEILKRQDALFQWAQEWTKGKVRIYNCGSPNSACTAFDKVDFEQLVRACAPKED